MFEHIKNIVFCIVFTLSELRSQRQSALIGSDSEFISAVSALIQRCILSENLCILSDSALITAENINFQSQNSALHSTDFHRVQRHFFYFSIFFEIFRSLRMSKQMIVIFGQLRQKNATIRPPANSSIIVAFHIGEETLKRSNLNEKNV